MILDQYKANNLFFNTNFCEASSHDQLQAYRGDLVIIDGGLDDKGHPNPPKEVLRGAVILADDKMHLLVGSLDNINMLPVLLEKFQADFADDIAILLFVVNAKARAIYDCGTAKISIIPLVQGVPWNEAVDEMALEKSDFKGQSPADKIYTLYQEMKSYKAKGELLTLEAMLAATTNQKREAWGAV